MNADHDLDAVLRVFHDDPIELVDPLPGDLSGIKTEARRRTRVRRGGLTALGAVAAAAVVVAGIGGADLLTSDAEVTPPAATVLIDRCEDVAFGGDAVPTTVDETHWEGSLIWSNTSPAECRFDLQHVADTFDVTVAESPDVFVAEPGSPNPELQDLVIAPGGGIGISLEWDKDVTVTQVRILDGWEALPPGDVPGGWPFDPAEEAPGDEPVVP